MHKSRTGSDLDAVEGPQIIMLRGRARKFPLVLYEWMGRNIAQRGEQNRSSRFRAGKENGLQTGCDGKHW